MASMNKVFLIGNLTRDPELKHLPSGTAVADLRMAVSRKFRTQTGEMKEDVCYVNVTAWGRQAETCDEYLSKGSPLLVEGRLQFEEWEKEGQRQSRLSVVAERTQFLGSPRQTQGGAAPQESAAPAPGPSAPAGDPVEDDEDNLPF